MFTAAVVAVLVTLSVILTASVLFPGASPRGRSWRSWPAAAAGAVAGRRLRPSSGGLRAGRAGRGRRSTAPGGQNWRMPPLALLHRPVMSSSRKIGMSALRLYLAVAMILVIIKIVQLAIGH